MARASTTAIALVAADLSQLDADLRLFERLVRQFAAETVELRARTSDCRCAVAAFEADVETYERAQARALSGPPQRSGSR